MKRLLSCVAVLALSGCTALNTVGDAIDDDCRSGGKLKLSQSYLDNYNDYLANKGRLFKIDGITCLKDAQEQE